MASQALTKTGGGAIATRESTNPLVQFRNQLEQRTNEFKAALPSHIKPETFQRTVITAVQSDPDLLLADRQSLVLACMKAAQDGLLPDKREAALVIFTENKKVGNEWVKLKKVQYMPMVYGLRKKILQSGEVQDITAKVVYRREAEEGFFVYEEGTDAMLRHRPMLDLDPEDATDANIVAAYSMATYKDGTKSYEVMRRFEITKVQNVSQTGALVDYKGQAREPKGPWKDWYPEQAKKTVMRRHSKTLPMSGDLVDVEVMTDIEASRSTITLLDSADELPPAISAPTREELVDPKTGEVIQGQQNDERSEEEIARELDRQSEAQANGQTLDDDEGQGNDAHPARAIADDLIARFKKAEIKRDFDSAKAKYIEHADAMPEEIYLELKAAYEAASARFPEKTK